jgi:hypothetical protein
MLRFALRALAAVVLIVPLTAGQPGRDAGCTNARECRDMALAAADRQEYDTFHTLAWRAVQLGPPRDPALMTMLARAQALSNRPHDALVMLDRLAEMGVAVDADTNDDFMRARRLPGWPDVLAHIERVRSSGGTLIAAGASPARPAAAAPAAPGGAPAAAETARPVAPFEAVRVPAGSFTPGGIAYDAVSERFLFGDRLGRKLIVVAARSNRATDFVRADSAGFHQIAGIEIDAKRGDLWVASGTPADGSGTLHKLQLVSGRALKSFPIAAEFEPLNLVDLTVTPAGAVLVLDISGGQLLVLRPGASAFERIIRLDAPEPSSLATGGDENVAYVAHRDGVLRVDLRARTAAPLTAPGSIPLDRLERIRSHGRSLVAVRVDGDGSRAIVRLDLNPSGRAVTQAATLEPRVPTTAPIYLTFSGDELVYLAHGGNGTDGGTPADAPRAGEFVAYRLRLR